MVLTVALGCTRTFSGEVTQPNPMVDPNETLRHSEEVVVITGDMDLRTPRPAQEGGAPTPMVKDRYPLVNKARFTIVSRDRLRVSVQLEHKWQDYVNVRNWYAYLVDDQGRRFEPVDIDRDGDDHVVMMWDYETRTAVRNGFGDITAINDDGFRDRRALGNLSVFRGHGDFVFYSKDLFGPELKGLTLYLERDGIRFKFTWKFADPADARGASGASG